MRLKLEILENKVNGLSKGYLYFYTDNIKYKKSILQDLFVGNLICIYSKDDKKFTSNIDNFYFYEDLLIDGYKLDSLVGKITEIKSFDDMKVQVIFKFGEDI